MWNRMKIPLVALSIGLNVAFITVWVGHALPGLTTGREISKTSVDDPTVPSSLHREIGVTPEQWNQIEPHVRHFREQARQQRQIIMGLRGQLMELLASPEADETAIRAKQEEILSGQRQMQNLVIGLLLKEKEILTPEQQKALLKVIHEHCKCGEGSGFQKGGIGHVLSEDASNPNEETIPE